MDRRRHRTRHVLVLLAALAVLAGAACSVSTGDDEATGSDGTGGGGEGTASAVEGPVLLGVATLDEQQLADLGVEIDSVDLEGLFTAWVDDQNASGGAGGRDIELAWRPFLPFDDADAQAACVELTEDDDAFAVLGIFLDDQSLCVTEAHETPYVGLWGLSAERAERSTAPFLAVEMADDRQRVAGIEALADDGAFDGRRVALYWAATDDPVVEASVRPALEDLGVDVVEEVRLDDFGDDSTATDQALDAIVERLRAAEPDVVLNVSDFAPPLLAFQRKGWAPEVIASTSAQALSTDVTDNLGVDAALLERVAAAAPYVPTKDELVADAEVQRCVDVYNATEPEAPIDLDTTPPEALVSIANHCAAFHLFVLAVDAAGDDLTTTSFGEGAASLGSVTLAGVPFGSLAPGKLDVGDAVGLYRWDAEAGRMVPVGPPVDAAG